MTIGKVIITTAVLAIAAPATAALAHDEGYYGYSRHDRDHAEHWKFHQEMNEAHRRAHEEGFNSPWEHRAYHRALRDMHYGFHDEHPNTWHDHYPRYRLYRWFGWWR